MASAALRDTQVNELRSRNFTLSNPPLEYIPAEEMRKLIRSIGKAA